MVGRWPQAVQGVEMGGGAVSGVALPAKARILERQRRHQGVAVNLGHHRSGGNRERAPIATDHRMSLTGQLGTMRPIDQSMIDRSVKTKRQGIKGTAHRQKGCLKDIEAVDLGDLGPADPDQSGLVQPGGQRLAPFRGQPLGIVQPVIAERWIETNRRRDHRTGERAAPHLVDTDDTTTQRGFKSEIGH